MIIMVCACARVTPRVCIARACILASASHAMPCARSSTSRPRRATEDEGGVEAREVLHAPMEDHPPGMIDQPLPPERGAACARTGGGERR